MAMTAFYMGSRSKRHGDPYIERVDKNGTEHWVDHNCPKCAGTGYLPGYEFIDGARCWRCNATGYSTHRYKKMTPEYEAKLETARVAKTRKKNLAERADFLARNGFNVDGLIFVVIGKTFEIKDDLKAAGAKFSFTFASWYFSERPEAYACVELTVEDCLWENALAALHWNDRDDILALIKARTPVDPAVSKSEYLGKVGERMTIIATLKRSFSFENNFGYRPTTTYIHNFEDDLGNVLIWKTGCFLREDTEYTLTGTVKEHSEYKETKQTVLTRCKTEAR